MRLQQGKVDNGWRLRGFISREDQTRIYKNIGENQQVARKQAEMS